jgi:HlyD family secretion protein
MIRDTAAQDRPVSAPARRLGRSLVVAVVVAAVLVLSLLAASGWASGARSVDAARLRIAEVSHGRLVRDIVADGRLTSAHSPTLYAIASGTVVPQVIAGDVVEQGQALAVIESPELESRLAQERSVVARLESEVGRAELAVRQQRQQATMRVEQAEVDRQVAARELERAREAHRGGVLPETELLRAQDALRKADIELAHAREERETRREIAGFELETRRLELERQRAVARELERQVEALTIRSPVDGQVGQLFVAPQEIVHARAPILTVVDLTAFELEIRVPESFARDLVVGMPAEISGDGHTYSGRVRSVSPEVVGGEVGSRLEFSGEPPERLRQNQRMSARILLDEKDATLQVERGASLDGGGYAYFVTGGVAERRPLRTGIVSLHAIEILEGASPGDRLVIAGADLFDGAERVRIAGDR